jgi:hypothetical protein
MATGFVLEIKGFWFLTTAGHVFRQVQELRQRFPTHRFTYQMQDNISNSSMTGIFQPLDFQGEFNLFFENEEEGLDLGLIPLNVMTQRCFRANNALTIGENHWDNWDSLKFESYYMIGVPYELSQPIGSKGLSISGALLPLTKLDEPPEQLRRFSYPMFVGQIESMQDLESIQGMSGCPIFGCFKDEEGDVQYRFVAVQSGWLPSRRVVFGCDLHHLVRLISPRIRRIEGSRTDGQTG